MNWNARKVDANTSKPEMSRDRNSTSTAIFGSRNIHALTLPSAAGKWIAISLRYYYVRGHAVA
jgi:hypothetical protein